jgi:hypothetical protein
VSTFPWDVLITAASTLTAALGSVGISNRYDRNARAVEAKRNDESSDADRQRAAYGALVTSATELSHAYSRQHLRVAQTGLALAPDRATWRLCSESTSSSCSLPVERSLRPAKLTGAFSMAAVRRRFR